MSKKKRRLAEQKRARAAALAAQAAEARTKPTAQTPPSAPLPMAEQPDAVAQSLQAEISANSPRPLKAPRVHIPQALWLLFAPLYCECLLRLAVSGFSATALPSVYILFFSLAAGAAGAVVPQVFRGRTRGVLCALWLALLGVSCAVEYGLNLSFKTFMPLSSVLTGAGDVMTGFGTTLFGLLLRRGWLMALFLLPWILFVVLGRRGVLAPPSAALRWRNLALGLVCAAALHSLAISTLLVHETDWQCYRAQYSFSPAVQRFGLLSAVRLDFVYSLTGIPDAQSLATDLSLALPAAQADAPLNNEAEAPATAEQAKDYGKNALDIDFAARAAADTNDTLRALDHYVAAQQPASQNAYTGLFAGKNLIFITAEAFSAEVIDPELTPTLYRLANSGIRFTDYYQPAWGGSTSTGEYANLTGLVPADGVQSIRETEGHNMYLTLGNQLQRLGYLSAAFHNGTTTYYDRNLTHPNLGYSTFTAMGNGMEQGVDNVWPASDLQMMQTVMPGILDSACSSDAPPFSLYFMTVSGHCTYSWASNAMSAKNREAVAGLSCSETVKAYYAANLELEYALAYLVNTLEQTGLANDTVIVLTNDHYPYGLEKSDTWGNTEDYLSELYGFAPDTDRSRDHSALIVWSGCLEPGTGQTLPAGITAPITVSAPTSSLDIVPTLSNLFGLSYDSRLFAGRDALSDEAPLVLWSNYSWLTEYGYYDADRKLFTPNEGATVPEDYVSHVSAVVQSRIAFSRNVLKTDYYAQLFGPDNAG